MPGAINSVVSWEPHSLGSLTKQDRALRFRRIWHLIHLQMSVLWIEVLSFAVREVVPWPSFQFFSNKAHNAMLISTCMSNNQCLYSPAWWSACMCLTECMVCVSVLLWGVCMWSLYVCVCVCASVYNYVLLVMALWWALLFCVCLAGSGCREPDCCCFCSSSKMPHRISMTLRADMASSAH